MKYSTNGSAAVSSGSDTWYYMSNGKKLGPTSADKLLEMLSSGELPPDTHVWTKALGKWTPANATELLARANDPKPSPVVINLETAKQPAPKGKSRWWIGLLIGILAVIAVAAAWFFLFREKPVEAAEEVVITYGLEEGVIFESDACGFIIDEIGEKGDYLELDVRCINKTDHALSFSWDSTCVNGSMFDPLWYVYVNGNSTTRSSITFPLSTLGSYQLLPAEEIRFVLSVFNEDLFREQQKESAKYIVPYNELTDLSLYEDYVTLSSYPGYLFASDVKVDTSGRPYYVNDEDVTVYFDEILNHKGQPLYGIASGVSHYNDFYADRYSRPYYFSNTGTTVYYEGYGFAFYDEENEKPYYYGENGKPAYYGNSGIPAYYKGEVTQEMLDADKPEDMVNAESSFLVHKEFTIYPTGKDAGEVTYPERITTNTEQIYWQGEKGSFLVLGGTMDEFRGYVVNTYIENNSDNYVYLGWQGATVNGVVTYPDSITALRPHSNAYRDIVIPLEVLRENGIETVEQIDFRVYAVGENLSVPLYPITWHAPVRK